MPRQNLSEDAPQLTTEQRTERRNRVMNMLAQVAHDGDHKRQMFRAKVGGQLTALLGRAGLSGAQVARKLNVSPSQLSRQLSGDANLTLNSLHDIAAAAGAKVSVQVELPGHSSAEVSRADTTRRPTRQLGSIFEEIEVAGTLSAVHFSRLMFRQNVIHRQQATEACFEGPHSASVFTEFEAANESSGLHPMRQPLAIGC